MKRKNNTIKVTNVILVALVVSFFAIGYKLFSVALSKETDGINLKEFRENRNTQTDILKAKRGNIYSSDKEVLAQSVNSYTVIAYLDPIRTTSDDNPQHVVNKKDTAEKLSIVLEMDVNRIMELLNYDAYQVELGPNGRGISEITKREIEALDLPGIDFVETYKRYYNMGTFASYILGYAQNDEEDTNGMMGIELYYNDELNGKDGYTIYQKDAYGYTIPNSTPITVPADNGDDVYLTIDSKIQMFVENGINDATSDTEQDWVIISVMDAKTGAVLASGSNPTFNPNVRVISNYLNPLISYTYEPGSTMKIFSFLAAMENGLYDGDETYQSGTVAVDDAVIKDSNNRGWGVITYDEGFSRSSNVAAANLALKVGKDRLYNYYASLGFGRKTGITLPNEYSGDINFSYRTELATASFGQGITSTPIQTLQALTILANDGVELQPYIVEKMVDSSTGEVTYQHERKELGKKASVDHIEKMKAMMYDVVDKGYTDARYYKLDSIKVIGKTGTAQIAGPDGQYMTGDYDYIRSFACLFPYEDPQYIIYVSAKRYQGQYQRIAKMVTDIIEEIAKYKNLSSNSISDSNDKIIELGNYISNDAELTAEKLSALKLNVIRLGSGKYIINQYPLKNSVVLINSKVFLLTNSDSYVMPDITGWSSNEVDVLCKLLKIRSKSTGIGSVTSFSIPVGTTLSSDLVLEVKYE